MKRRTAFTLLEIMLALSIIVVIMGVVLSFYTYSAKLAEAGRKKLDDIQLARVVLFKIASELQAVTASGSRFSAVLKGDSKSLNCMTTAVPSRLVFFPTDITDSGKVIEHDLRLVEYTLARSEDDDTVILGLRRDELRCLLTSLIEKDSSDTLSEEDTEKAAKEKKKFSFDLEIDSNKAISDQPVISQTILSDRIRYLNFDYYNGKKWVTQWNPTKQDTLPRAVRVTIGFSEIPDEQNQQELLLQPDERPWHEDQYSLTMSLILADDLKTENATQEDTTSK